MANPTKGNAIWESFKTAVPGLAERLDPAQPPSEAGAEFARLTAILPGDVRQQVQTCSDPEGPRWQREIEHVWCLCDMAEGEFPKTYRFESLQDLAAAIARAEGRETALVAFYGVALPFSKVQASNSGKRCRYLMLPNDMAAVVGEQFRLIERSLLPADLELEDQGWVGDPAHLEPATYYKSGYVEDDEFSADPDLDADDVEDDDNEEN